MRTPVPFQSGLRYCHSVRELASIDGGGSVRFQVVASTEAPVDQRVLHEGEERLAREILLHRPDGMAPDATAISSRGGMPVLRGHSRDAHIGRVVSARVERGELIADLEVFADSSDGERTISAIALGYSRGVSIGYEILNFRVLESNELDDNGLPILLYQVFSWRLKEVSSVSVPADSDAGVLEGAVVATRAKHGGRVIDLDAVANNARGGDTMKDETDTTPPKPAGSERAAEKPAAPTPPVVSERVAPEPKVPLDASVLAAARAAGAAGGREANAEDTRNTAAQRDARNAEVAWLNNHLGVLKTGERAQVDAVIGRFMQGEITPQALLQISLKGLRDAEASVVRDVASIVSDTELTTADYAIAATAERGVGSEALDHSQNARRLLGSIGVGRELQPNSILMPIAAMRSRRRAGFTSSTTAGVPTNTGTTTGTGDTSGQHSEWIDDWYEMERLPALALNTIGVGRETTGGNNYTYQIQVGTLAAQWRTETQPVDNSSFSGSNRSTSPKRLSIAAQWSLLRTIQDRSDLERRINFEILRALEQARELAVINGSGTGAEPTGIFNTSGVGSATFGTTANLGGSASKDTLSALELTMQEANLTGDFTILTTPAVLHKARNTQYAVAGSPTDTTLANRAPGGENQLLWYRVATSNLMPKGLTKGTSAALYDSLIFGNFSGVSLLNYGFIELVYDDITLARSGQRQLVANTFEDVVVRQRDALTVVRDISIA